nr:hypothetical protein [Tanacetum cinerariifolium]
LSLIKPTQDLSHTLRPSAPIIEEWVSDSEDESETKTPQNAPSFVQPTNQVNAVRLVTTAAPKTRVTRPRQAKPVVTKSTLPLKRHINCSPSLKASNFPPKVTTAKASMVNAAKDKEVIDSGFSRHMIGNMSYLSDFEELNGGYVAFGGNPKGGLENQLSLKVKKIRSDNGTKFKNNDLNQFCGMKGIKRKFSVPRTPQKKGIAERKNRTLIEATRIMLADSLLPIPFWAEAVKTACYVQNRVLVTKPHNKTPYELLHGKFDGNVDEGFLVGYSVSSKAFRVFNSRTRIIQETLHVLFSVWSSGSTNSQNSDGDAAFDEKELEFEAKKPESNVNISPSSSSHSCCWAIFTDNTNIFSAAGPSNTVVSPTHRKSSCIDTSQLPDDLDMPKLEDITYFNNEDDVGAEADFNNLETSITVSPIPKTRVHKYHRVTQIISDLSSATQTRSMTRVAKDQGGLSQINNEDFHTCMFACFLSQKEPKRVHQALKDPSWIEAMQEELL